MERVPTISDIFINPNFDSALEARFMESLQRLGGVAGLPPVKLVQDIVGGKSGFLLEVGSERYWVEPQVDLGAADGVAVPSRPDFLISPAQSRSARKPIAVFCDGWAYHRATAQADALKRSAIVASGRFWIWSVTNNDVKTALEGNPTTDLEPPLTALNRHTGERAPDAVPRAEPQAFTKNAIAQLLALLAKPADDTDPATEQLKRNAVWATFLMVPVPGTPEFNALEASMKTLWQGLPGWMQTLPSPSAPSGSRDHAHPWLRMWWPAQFGAGQLDAKVVPGLLVHDDESAAEDVELNTRWRRWLALFNTLQTVPGMVLATQKGLKGADYEVCAPTASKQPPSPGAAGSVAWQAAIEQAVGGVQAGMRTLADMDAPPPDHVGFEIASDAGEVIAEAELAWVVGNIVLLHPEQSDYEPVWREDGWSVVLAEGEWQAKVAALIMKPR
jgi:DEAD/DEAH box helicase domain-containing protein